MLRLENIVKDYGTKEQAVHVLKGLSVQFRRSEFVSILGHSGCGKTTLLNLIGGLDSCTEGVVYLDGKSTNSYTDSDWNLYRNKQIGFVFQNYNLIPHLSVEKNVELPLALSDVSKRERRERALAALEIVGLRDQARKRPNQLSGGQMQRVAIARALVNNPSIILADEPTGALDSESGVQVMNILKEVANDKLVIMVTHNDSLADEYSTRIIKMSDGEIIDDTDPYSLEDCLQAEMEDAKRKSDERESIISSNTKNEKERKSFLRKLRKQEYEKRMKTSMSLGTAMSMSLTNLRCKLGRSLLTSIAGSIGIIGIMMVLALSTGVNGYISTIEQNALSQYPITINDTNMDLMGAMGLLSGMNEDDRPSYPDSDKVYIQPMVGNLMKNIQGIFSTNDLGSLMTYIDDNFDDSLGYVKYGYGVSMDIYRKIDGDTDYTWMYPFTDSIKDVIPEQFGSLMDTLQQYGAAVNSWDELIDNQTLLNSQYELIGDSRWPTKYNELVLVVDEKNQISDYMLFILGLLSPNTLGDMLTNGTNSDVFAEEYELEDLLNLTYMAMTGNDYYHKNDSGKWVQTSKTDRLKSEFVEANAVELKVVGVVRPKEGATVTCINGCIAYTSDLVQYLSNRAGTKEGSLYKNYLENGTDYNDKTLLGDKEINAFKREMGVCTYETPTSISIYANSFENKDKIVAFLDSYNDRVYNPGENPGEGTFECSKCRERKEKGETTDVFSISFDEDDEESVLPECPHCGAEITFVRSNKIKYSDNLSTIMTFVNTLTETMTRVLVGFAAISLVVSSIMIAIIIYTSVLERRKEIGILRSVGARKIDISSIFISESSLLGVTSGLIGIFITWLLTLFANYILKLLLGISDLAIIVWWSPLVMLFISVVLSFIAGVLPARIAANKDPVECLRSE